MTAGELHATPWDDRATVRFLAQGTASAAAAALVPPIVAAVTGDARLAKPAIAMILLGICSGLAWLAVAALWYRTRNLQRLPIVLITAVMMSFAMTLARHPEPHWDYAVGYESSAQHLAAGRNPYVVGETTNPPAFPQLMIVASTVLRATVMVGAEERVVWFWIYYGYQALQLALIAALFGLCYRIARDAGRRSGEAVAFVAVALLLCAPLQESLWLNQLDLIVAVLATVAVLLSRRHPAWAGLVAGVGGAIKLYPLGAGLAWLVTRRRKPIAWMALAMLLMVAAGWPAWKMYGQYFLEMQRPTITRDTSLHSVAVNATRVAGGLFALEQEGVRRTSFVIWIVLDAAVLAWLLRRQRARRLAGGLDDETLDARTSWEIIAVLPLIFPLGWTHHYLLVLPLAISRIAAHGFSSPAVTFGVLLALVQPATDSFPLGMTRLLGTLLLLASDPATSTDASLTHAARSEEPLTSA